MDAGGVLRYNAQNTFVRNAPIPPYSIMPLLIDGYNLLHASGILGRGVGPGGLERSRTALLNFLAASIDERELRRTTVVFDAADAPRGLPRAVGHRGMTVRFASKYDSADEMIEELIRQDSAPKRLTVVSGDNRIQRAARRRRAKAVASDVWFAELIRSRQDRAAAAAETPVRPHAPMLEEDVNYWLRQFGGVEALAKFARREAGNDLDNPFPPGYGRELEDEK